LEYNKIYQGVINPPKRGILTSAPLHFMVMPAFDGKLIQLEMFQY
jgi:hypothetical protein